MYAMKDQGKCYDSLFEESQAVMLLIDPGSARIVDANPSACEFYGYHLEDLIARQISDIYEGHAANFYRLLAFFVSSAKPSQF